MKKGKGVRYVKPTEVEFSIDIDWSNFPDAKQLVLYSHKDLEEVKHLPKEEQETELNKRTPMDITVYEFDAYIQTVVDWLVKQINEGLRIHRVKVTNATLNPFDRTHYKERQLFTKALELYRKRIKNRRSYSYIASLEEANEKHRIIEAARFDLDLPKINRNYTNWRKAHPAK